MKAETDQTSLLINAVRQPVSALTVVETDSRYRAASLIDELLPFIGDRPRKILELDPEAGAVALMDRARDAAVGWPPESGLLFVVDTEKRPAEAIENPFWRQMNTVREGLAALACHVIFFLLPGSYRKFLRLADHLADWTPLKLHIMGDGGEYAEKSPSSTSAILESDMDFTPGLAKQRLAGLEKQLVRALQGGGEPSALIRRYYLPMLRAAVSMRDIQRANSLRCKIKAADIPEPDLFQWYELNFRVDHLSYRLAEAENWARKMQNRGEKKNINSWKAIAYHNLGMIAQERQYFENAERWYRKSLAIKEKQGDDHGAANTYHNLGVISQARRDFESAERWYRNSLATWEKQGDGHGVAGAYHNLGMLSQVRRDFESAERWYRKSLAIEEKQGNEHGAAITYHQLGRIAQERRDFESAEAWYRKSLAIKEKHGDSHGAANTYGQLGLLAKEKEDFSTAARWLSKSAAAFSRTGDENSAGKVAVYITDLFNNAPAAEKEAIRTIWTEAGLPSDIFQHTPDR